MITINRFDATALEDNLTKAAQKCPAPNGPFREPKYVNYVGGHKDWNGITYFTDKLLSFVNFFFSFLFLV